MTISAAKLFMVTTTMFPLLISFLREISLFPVPGTKQLSCGRFQLDSVREHIQDMKDG